MDMWKMYRRSSLGASHRPFTLVALVFMMSQSTRPSFAMKPDGLVVVSRHGVRRQFPSSSHDFAKYAPGKEFQETDEVCTVLAQV